MKVFIEMKEGFRIKLIFLYKILSLGIWFTFIEKGDRVTFSFFGLNSFTFCLLRVGKPKFKNCFERIQSRLQKFGLPLIWRIFLNETICKGKKLEWEV